MAQIYRCPKCGQLPDIHLCGRSENGPRAKVKCCGFGADVSAKTKEEAIKTALDVWNLRGECFDIGAKKE